MSVYAECQVLGYWERRPLYSTDNYSILIRRQNFSPVHSESIGWVHNHNAFSRTLFPKIPQDFVNYNVTNGLANHKLCYIQMLLKI